MLFVSIYACLSIVMFFFGGGLFLVIFTVVLFNTVLYCNVYFIAYCYVNAVYCCLLILF